MLAERRMYEPYGTSATSFDYNNVCWMKINAIRKHYNNLMKLPIDEVRPGY